MKNESTQIIIKTASIFAILFQLASASHARDAPKQLPNIIVIYADDLGYGDVQCYNPKRGKIPTPHIDSLATQGMRFTDAHSSSGVCSPSRYTLLTGRYHWRSRLQRGIVGLWESPLITPERLTIGSLAKQHGYRSACIGKWHLGWNWPIPAGKKKLFASTGYNGKKDLTATDEHRAAWREAFSQPIPGGPIAFGFDEYFGTDVPNWPPYCFIENDRTVGIPSEFGAPELFTKNQASQQGPALRRWQLEPILPALGDRAAAFIRREAEAKAPGPFLIYMPLTSPHTPLSVNDEWKGKSGLNLYADFVMETDAVVGRVLEALEKSRAADSTLVVFTSDNGCAPYIGVGDLEKMGHYPSGPLRGYKSDAWEGGHRVPFIVRWPGVVKPDSVCDQLVHQADLMATFAGILGTKLPDDAGEDSFSLMPLLEGGNEPIREHAISAASSGLPAVRLGRWKYIPAPGSGGWGKGGDQSQPVQLYDLADDIGETRNRAALQSARVAQMQALLETLVVQGRSTPGPKQNNDVEVRRHSPKPAKAIRKKAIAAEKPNIIFIFADDWGWGDLSCHGHPYVKTPNIDRLAKEGTDFHRFTVASGVCSPSRTAVMTGHFPARYNIDGHFAWVPSNAKRNMPDWLSPQAPLLPRFLQQAGYATAHFGKWHLSNNMIPDSPLPSEYGYDEYGAFNCAGEQMPVHEDARNAIAFIEKSNREKKPFFINLWIHEPHTPFHTVPKYRWRFRDLEERDNIYASVLSHADDRIGEVLDVLDRLKLTDNTLVIFSSDNGPARAARFTEPTLMHDTATGAGYGIGAAQGITGGRKGYKAALFEGGIGVPFIARWPGKIAAGKVDKDSLFSAVDLLPTFCELAGVRLPDDYNPDGVSQVNALLGNGSKTRSKPLFWKMQSAWPIQKARPYHWVSYTVMHENWKLLTNRDSSYFELYDLVADPYEKNDLSEERPETIVRLQAELEAWKKTLPATPTGNVFSNERQ